MTIHDAVKRIAKKKKGASAANIHSVDDLREADADYNPRHADYDAIQRLEKTLSEFGDLSGIVFNVQTGNLVGGHQRKKTLDSSWKITKESVTDPVGTVAVGYIHTPSGRLTYREVDWETKKEMAANLAANASTGKWVYEKRNEMFEFLNDGEFDLELTGHSMEDIEKLLTWAPGETEAVQEILNSSSAVGESETHDDYKPKEKHHLQQAFEANPESVAADDLATVKINLEFEMMHWLDGFYRERGFQSRSEAVRYIIKHYRGDLDVSEG